MPDEKMLGAKKRITYSAEATERKTDNIRILRAIRIDFHINALLVLEHELKFKREMPKVKLI